MADSDSLQPLSLSGTDVHTAGVPTQAPEIDDDSRHHHQAAIAARGGTGEAENDSESNSDQASTELDQVMEQSFAEDEPGSGQQDVFDDGDVDVESSQDLASPVADDTDGSREAPIKLAPANEDAIQAEKALAATTEARRSLKEDIEHAVELHHGEGCHYWSNTSLIVMAIICSANEFVEESEILNWASETFPFEEEPPLGRTYVHMGSPTYDTPISAKFNHSTENRSYTIDSKAARVVLQRELESEATGAFRFLDLPAELRNRVYEMLLHISDSQIEPLNSTLSSLSVLECRLCARGYTPEAPRTDSKGHAWYCHRYPYSMAFCDELVAPIMACRQMYSEAMPLMYSINQFRFKLRDLDRALSGITENQSKHLKKVHIDLGGMYRLDDSRASLQMAHTKVGRMPTLEELALAIEENDWLDMIGSYEKIPELVCLAKMAAAAKSFKVYGLDGRGCPKFEAFISNEVEKLESQASVQASGPADGASGNYHQMVL